MGLGKTIQVISFLSAIMSKHGDQRDADRRKTLVEEFQDSDPYHWRKNIPPANSKFPTALIIAPSTVVENWVREFQKWAYFDVGAYVGPKKIRGPVLDEFKLGRLDVVLTSFDLGTFSSYTYLNHDADCSYFLSLICTARDDIELLQDLDWSCVFIDEAHRVKNPASATTKAFRTFDCQLRFGLTGTAIQNTYRCIVFAQYILILIKCHMPIQRIVDTP